MLMQIRSCSIDDVAAVRAFVKANPPLDLHSAFTYWVLFSYQNDLCFLMEDEAGRIIGFVSGVTSSRDPGACYLWQLAVDAAHRRSAVAHRLTAEFHDAACRLGCRRIQFSIDPANAPSLNAAHRFAAKRGLDMKKVSVVSIHDSIDFIDVHEDVYEIGLPQAGDRA